MYDYHVSTDKIASVAIRSGQPLVAAQEHVLGWGGLSRGERAPLPLLTACSLPRSDRNAAGPSWHAGSGGRSRGAAALSAGTMPSAGVSIGGHAAQYSTDAEGTGAHTKHSRARGRASSSTARERATHRRYQRRGTRLTQSVRARAAPARASKRMYEVHGAVPCIRPSPINGCTRRQHLHVLDCAKPSRQARRGADPPHRARGKGGGRTAHRPGDDLRRVLDGVEPLERPRTAGRLECSAHGLERAARGVVRRLHLAVAAWKPHRAAG